MISPTIGRRVWYWPSIYDTGVAPDQVKVNNAEQACDAGVVYVWSDRMVNLDVCDHHGNHHARPSITLLQEGDLIPEHGGYATWMPYQTKAAAPAVSERPFPAFAPAERT